MFGAGSFSGACQPVNRGQPAYPPRVAPQSCIAELNGLPCPHQRLVNSSRCGIHQPARDRFRRRSVPTKRVEPKDRARRAAAVRAHVARHGWVCPGYGVSPHPSRDLTADDVVPVAATGRPSAELRVLCRSCNSRKAAR